MTKIGICARAAGEIFSCNKRLLLSAGKAGSGSSGAAWAAASASWAHADSGAPHNTPASAEAKAVREKASAAPGRARCRARKEAGWTVGERRCRSGKGVSLWSATRAGQAGFVKSDYP